MATDMFLDIDELLRLYLTIPVMICTAQRNISPIWHMKNTLRSMISEECLNNVMLLHVHKQETEALDLYTRNC